MAHTLDDALRLHRAGRTDEALDIYRALVDADPGNADAWHLLGVAAHQRGDHVLAAELVETAVALHGRAPEYHSNLAMIRLALDDEAGAAAALEAALAIDPGHAKALANLAGVRRRTGAFAEAVDLAERAVALRPGDAEAWVNLGNARRDVGRVADAVAAFRRAIDIRPDYPLAHWDLALALLLAGDYPAGFAELDWRWRWGGYVAPRRDFAQPRWRGEPLAGRTLLVHAEQGLGDTVQLARYLPLAAARGGPVVMEVPAPLAPLFRDSPLEAEVAVRGEPLPGFQVEAPLFDLPAIFGTTVETVPAHVPYLAPDPALAAAAEDRLEAQSRGGGLRVGLNWSGNPAVPVERFRRVPLEAFTALAEVPGIEWADLQRGPDAHLVPPAPETFGLVSTGPEPVERTAALIQCLDLVITSDTFVAHLAGALGKPLWVALHHVPDWRWHLERSDSPWYPTARLFRQTAPGDWAGVAADMAAALHELAARRR